MTITCPQCKTRHDIDESRIPPQATMARCRRCGHRFPLEAKSKGNGNGNVSEESKKALMEEGGREARIIGVMLSKGGVGKTTTAVNLSAGLAMAGFQTLLIDTDTQGQGSYMLGVTPECGLTELLMGEVGHDDAIVNARDNLWLLAGGKSLAGVKRVIDRKDFGGEWTLSESLAPLSTRFDYIIVDSSPGWDPVTVNVLFYVQEVLTPVSLEAMSLQGLSEFLKSLNAIRRYNDKVRHEYILPTFLDKRVKHPFELLDRLSKIYPDIMCKPIRYNVRLSEAPASGMTIFEFAPQSPGAQDYGELVKRIAGEGKGMTAVKTADDGSTDGTRVSSPLHERGGAPKSAPVEIRSVTAH